MQIQPQEKIFKLLKILFLIKKKSNNILNIYYTSKFC